MKKIYENFIFISILFLVGLMGAGAFASILTLEPNARLKQSTISVSAQSNLEFAKVKSGCILYKTENTASDDFQNMLFEIPESYFVNVISRPNQNTFKVKYGEFIGFIDVSFAAVVSFTPKNPTLTGITFSIKSEAGTQLRNSPDANNLNNVLTNIPSNAQGLTYIAKISGERPTGGTSDVWYYAVYSPQTSPTSVYYGYVYSERTENLSTIPANIENDIIEPSSSENFGDYGDNDLYISAPVRTILIGLVCLPVVILFVVFLFKVKSRKKENLLKANKSGQAPHFQFQNSPANLISPSPARKTIKSFINKSYYKADKIKSVLASTSAITNKSNLALDALDDDDML